MQNLVGVADRMRERRKTLSNHIADVLREAIVTGAVRENEELNQVAVAAQFGTSRIPVREAMRQLESEGLVEAKPHHQVVVTALSIERLQEIFEIRVELERLAIRHAVPRLTPERLAALERLHERMECEADHSQWRMLNRAFHMEFARLAERPMLCDLLERLSDHSERYVARAHAVRHEEVGQEHLDLLEACRRGDAATAEQLLERHIVGTLDKLSARLRTRIKEG